MEISLDYYYSNNTSGHGGMVDALDSDSSERDFVEVQVLLTAPYFIKRLLLIALA